jgi:hypothetical protein
MLRFPFSAREAEGSRVVARFALPRRNLTKVEFAPTVRSPRCRSIRRHLVECAGVTAAPAPPQFLRTARGSDRYWARYSMIPGDDVKFNQSSGFLQLSFPFSSYSIVNIGPSCDPATTNNCQWNRPLRDHRNRSDLRRLHNRRAL